MDFSSTCAFLTFKPRFSIMSFVDRKPCRKAPRLNSCPFSTHQMRTPIFHSLFEKVAGGFHLISPAVSSSGFGYPHEDFSSSRSQEASFSSRCSWVSPYKAFLRPIDRNEVSFTPLRSCVSLENLIGLPSTLQRFTPSRTAVPLFASGRISSGRGRMLS